MKKNKKLNVEEYSFQCQLYNHWKNKSKRQVFIDGYNKALNDRFNETSKIIIYTLFTIGILAIVYGFFKIV